MIRFLLNTHSYVHLRTLEIKSDSSNCRKYFLPLLFQPIRPTLSFIHTGFLFSRFQIVGVMYKYDDPKDIQYQVRILRSIVNPFVQPGFDEIYVE